MNQYTFPSIVFILDGLKQSPMPRGRPPLRWADQIVNDTQLSLSDAVTATQDRTSWRSLVRDATRPATQARRCLCRLALWAYL